MSLLFGSDPVVQKELRGVSRRWHTYVGRCLFVGLTAYLIYEYWTGLWRGAAARGGTISVSQYAELGRAIFTRTELVSLALTVLAAVIAGSDMIAREIRNGTLGLLLLTPMTPLQIVVGKWKSAMMIAIALYLCGLPVLSVAVYLGGVGASDLARSAVFTLGLAGVAAAVSIAASARLKSGGAAVAYTLPLMILVLLCFMIADALGTWVYWMCFPLSEIPHRGGVATTLTAAFFWVIALGHALRLVRQRTGAIEGPDEHAREHRTLALDALREKRASPPRRVLRTWRVVWEHNPLLWKEFTLRPALRIREDWRTRATIILFFALISTWILGDGAAILPIWGAFFTMVAVAGGSLLFAPEKEGKQWLLLLSTPITAAQIVRAKLMCGLIFPEALGLIGIYIMALLIWLYTRASQFMVAAASAATLFILFAYVLAAAASLRARTARGAFMVAGGILAFLITVPSLLSDALRPLTPGLGSYGKEAWNWFEALDPMTVLNSYRSDSRSLWTAERAYAPRALECSLRYFALYLPVTLLLPLDMVWRFRRIAIRS